LSSGSRTRSSTASWTAVARALAGIVARLRRQKDQQPDDEPIVQVYVSRGLAASLAADDVAEAFGEPGPLVVEAVEEPSSIAGWEVTELSYVGIEPWIVLLLNVERQARYIVVVNPDGQIAGRLATPLLEWEPMFLHPGG
jgi:hypothetical protein